MIKVQGLNKEFKVHQKEPGFLGSLKSLVKREYIIKKALDNIDLNIESGEIVGLLGSNGAGKTTLTKILAGIIHPSSGNVSIMGHEPWQRNNEYRKTMSLIMGQKSQLWWDLPAMDGFLLLKEIYQIPTQQFKENIKYLSQCLMIEDQLKVQVRRLSLGERMKVELMAALLHNPKIVFLDEPTIGLDFMAQKAVRQFIKEYRKKYNPLMILTSHYMDDIKELCERVIIMKNGSFIFDGPMSKIQNDYNKDKLITASPQSNLDAVKLQESFPSELGSFSLDDKGLIKIKSHKDQAMQAASFLLNNLQVKDLNIQEEDIADVIEKIMRNGQANA